MNEERKKILEMLSAGKITAEDAERLLDKIEGGFSSAPKEPRKPGEKGKLKWLLVRVDSNDGDKVNVRVPINLIRTGREAAGEELLRGLLGTGAAPWIEAVAAQELVRLRAAPLRGAR